MGLLVNRRRLLGVGGDLPAGYRRVAFVYTNGGTAWLDTGVSPFTASRLEVVKRYVSFPAVNNSWADGWYSANAQNVQMGVKRIASGPMWMASLGSLSAHYQTFGTADAEVHFFSLDWPAGVFRIDGDSYAVGTVYRRTGYMCSYLLGAVGRHKNPTPYRQGDVELYAARLVDAGTGVAVRDFVPCVREKDGVAGMWDRVTKRMFVSAGTAAFTAGPDGKVELPYY